MPHLSQEKKSIHNFAGTTIKSTTTGTNSYTKYTR